MSSERIGFVWRCDAAGILREVYCGALQPSDRGLLGRPVVEAVDAASQGKARALLDQLRDDGIALDWELNVPFGGAAVLVHCDAARVGDALVVAGAPTPSETARLLDEALQGLDGPHAALLRAVVRERARRLDPGLEHADALYNELSRFNNELAAVQRDLFKQNVVLEKLNAQKNYFLGVAAHELRNPLTTIRFYSDFLRQHADRLTAEQQRRMLDNIYERSGFMARLIDDLLTVSKIEAGHLDLSLEEVDLVALAAHSVELNQILAEKKHIALRLDAAASRLPCRADAAKIEQVINNLLTNAIKYSEADTEVHVRVERRNGEVLLAVQDHGPGIAPGERDKLFQPFERTSARPTAGEPSTGLGLSISRRIVEGHHGRLWVESQRGRGSTFYVALPGDEGGVEIEDC